MHTLEIQAARSVPGATPRDSHVSCGRTSADATSILLELTRALRGLAARDGP